MKLTLENTSIQTIMKMSGRLDADAASELEKKITELIPKKQKELIVDLEQINFLSSAGIRLFLELQRQCQKKKKRFVLRRLSDVAKEVLRIAGMEHLFEIVETL